MKTLPVIVLQITKFLPILIGLQSSEWLSLDFISHGQKIHEMNTYLIRLRRYDTSTPWGFRLNGGADLGIPLHVQKVSFATRNSLLTHGIWIFSVINPIIATAYSIRNFKCVWNSWNCLLRSNWKRNLTCSSRMSNFRPFSLCNQVWGIHGIHGQMVDPLSSALAHLGGEGHSCRVPLDWSVFYLWQWHFREGSTAPALCPALSDLIWLK